MTRTGRPRSSPARLVARSVAVLGLSALLCASGAHGASAHVLLETAAPNGDGTTTLTFSFEHGCDGQPTTALDVSLPDGVEAISTTQPDGWSSTQDGASVRWSGTPVEDGTAARFELVATITGDVGQAFVFPTTQTCTEGSTDWADVDPSAAHPAPSFVATSATLVPRPAQPVASTGGGASLPQTLAVVGASTLVAAATGTWWVRRRSR